MIKIIFLSAVSLLLLPVSIIFADKQTEDKPGEAFRTMMFISDGRNYIDTSTGATTENIDSPSGTMFCDFNQASFTVDADRTYTVLITIPKKVTLSNKTICVTSLPHMLNFEAGGVVAIEIWDGEQRILRKNIIFVNAHSNIDYEFIPTSANIGIDNENHDKVQLDMSEFFGRDGAKIRSDTQFIDFSFRTIPVVPENYTADDALNEAPQTDIAKSSESQQAGSVKDKMADSPETAKAENEPVLSSNAGTDTISYSKVVAVLAIAGVCLGLIVVIIVRHRKK